MDQYRRVLVIDDEADVRRMLVAALRQKPLVIDEACDGHEAIELLREHHYSIVLLDLMMPNVDGFEVLDAIGNGTNPPIVLVVTGAERPLLDRVESRMIHGIVKKPFDPLEIAEVVAACAEIRSRSALETMAYATVMAGAPLIALLKL